MIEDSPFTQLAHKLRNPLNTISMNAELAKLQLSPAVEGGKPECEAALGCLEVILRACRDCAEILEQITEPPALDR